MFIYVIFAEGGQPSGGGLRQARSSGASSQFTEEMALADEQEEDEE